MVNHLGRDVPSRLFITRHRRLPSSADSPSMSAVLLGTFRTLRSLQENRVRRDSGSLPEDQVAPGCQDSSAKSAILIPAIRALRASITTPLAWFASGAFVETRTADRLCCRGRRPGAAIFAHCRGSRLGLAKERPSTEIHSTQHLIFTNSSRFEGNCDPLPPYYRLERVGTEYREFDAS
jgi:hypothetical protein